jgi:hypothetical protein
MNTKFRFLSAALIAMLGVTSCTVVEVPPESRNQVAMATSTMNRNTPSQAELYATGMEGASSREWTNRAY